mmetsp:Transcript_27718/g.59242  ORF Transcript_27718/g.59242 Transcript_27718/m.59242 type:complete len:437 (-) Transcript_27718:340-1650(-)|eukprot:CAMPEP_0201134484 /NCGR_PEP_ID=MMETSP0850-20130426/51730_1 /ASSEMBLY_ACC=CAM_ASM_000622 /TAXON_ID=183588 /ORGANISM="Pseudo-nitzschia fraudulenta, Strain WWA7" /LENGTH=436 /DNA_ID=CAMNT_0047405383 /DNA_START=52 /DNA_END=1362 /DNA_ORIENTATION=+
MAMKDPLFATMMVAVLVFSLVATAAVASKTEVLRQPEAYQQRLVDWIRSGKNGFFHPKVQWKRLGEDGTGPYAMHTTVDIPKGETLLVVPRSHIIDSYRTHWDCVTIARMLHEYDLGDESFFAPYVSYLFDSTVGGTSTGLLPTSWSDDGKHLLKRFVGRDDEKHHHHRGRGLEPYYFEHEGVFEMCGSNFRAESKSEELKDEDERQHTEDAYAFHLSRSWGDKMVPVLDMYNHRNGASKNVESTSAHAIEEDVTAFALRDIKAGEQLQNTYSECLDNDCDWGEMKYSYLTQNIFMDYGFLEMYPRRWLLGLEDDGNDERLERVIAEVDQDLESGEKTFRWIFERPGKQAINWITEQLDRLRDIEIEFALDVAKHKKKTAKLAGSSFNIEHEAASLLEIYEGYVEILEMALEHKDDPVGVTLEAFEEELEELRSEL